MRDNLADNHRYHVTVEPQPEIVENPVKTPQLADFEQHWVPADNCQDVPYTCQETPLKKERPRNAPGTRQVPLSKGMFALVSAEDYDRVMQHKWMARLEKKTWYAVRDLPREPGRKSRSKQKMHRFIMGLDGPDVDHKDGDGLNNTRENLRHATAAQNNCNVGKPRHGTTSPYKGVSWHPKAKKWQASIRFNRHQNYLGLFLDPAAAARAYDREALNLFGEFARLNFPEAA